MFERILCRNKEEFRMFYVRKHCWFFHLRLSQNFNSDDIQILLLLCFEFKSSRHVLNIITVGHKISAGSIFLQFLGLMHFMHKAPTSGAALDFQSL